MKRSIAQLGILLVVSSAAAAASTPLLTAGSSVLTLADAELLLAQVPLAQRTASDPSNTVDLDPVSSWVAGVLIPRFLLDTYARRLEQTERWKPLRDGLLARLLEADLHSRTTVSEADVAAYYSKHPKAFSAPEAILLSRILVATEDQARTLIQSIKTPAGLKQWGALCREHSIDTATKLRNGRLGFVRSDGSTDVPQVRANPALYQAAHALRDGELAAIPVAEGSNFAVVWRRATRPIETQPLPEVAPTIQMILERDQVQTAHAQLLTDLRTRYVTGYQSDTIEALNYPADPGLPIPKRALEQNAPSVAGKPVLGDRGER